jgi:trigger factor
MPEAFDKNIKGMKIGDEKEFDFSFENDPLEALEGLKEMHVKAKLKNIRLKKLPELTDIWVKETIAFEGVDELKQRITDSIKDQKGRELPALKERLVANEIEARLEGEPTDLVVRQTEQMLYRDFFENIQRLQTTFDQYLANNGITAEVFQESIHQQAISNAKMSLGLDAAARHFGYEVSEEEVIEEFKMAGAPDHVALYEEWKAEGRLSEIRIGLLRMRAAKQLADTAEVFAIGTKPAPKKSKKAAKAKKADAADKAEAVKAKAVKKPAKAKKLAAADAEPAGEEPAAKPKKRAVRAKKTAAAE